MKTMTIVSVIIVAAGLYIEYQKDSSFASIDTGSIFIGAGLGLLVGGMI